MFFKGKVSIVIPVYNSQDYLERCLESILSQTYDNYEVILVDDGSDDFSEMICKKYSDIYEDIIYYYRINHCGQGMARNFGIDHSTGEYISFIDSDDDIHKDMYKKMVACAEKTSADIVVCNVRLFFKDEVGFEIQYSINYGEKNVQTYMQYGVNLCSPCNKIFKRALFKERRFQQIIYEDMELIPVIVSYASNVQFIDKHFYNYRLRDSSTINGGKNFNITHMFDAIISSIKNVASSYQKQLVYWHARSLLDNYFTNLISYQEEIKCFINNNQSLFFNNDLIKNDYYVKQIFNLNEGKKDSSHKTDYMFTIITSLSEKYWNNVLDKQTIRPENVQIIYRDKGTFVCPDQILGKYFLFLDIELFPDDNFLSELFLIGEVYNKKSSLIAIPISFQKEITEGIDLAENYSDFQPDEYFYVFNSIIFKNCKINPYFEDTLYFYYTILHNPLVVCANLALNYSLVNTSKKSEDLFHQDFISVNECRSACNLCVSLCLGIPVYIQYFIMSKLKKISETKYEIDNINDFNLKQFKEIFKETLSFIDDKVIMDMPRTTPEHRVFFFNVRYGKKADIVQDDDDLVKLLQNRICIYCQDKTYTLFEFIDYKDNVLRLEGRTIALNCSENEDILFFAEANGIYYPAKQLKRDCNRYWLDELLYKGIEFEIKIPISANVGLYTIKFFYMYEGFLTKRMDIRFAKYAPLTKRFKNSYYKEKDRVLTYADNTLFFQLCGRRGKILHERDFLNEIKEIESQKKYREIRNLRLLYLFSTILRTKKIWLISDKAHRADDNGEAFFKFMNSSSQLKKKVKTYFIIDKNVSDYQRLEKLGHTVQFNSFKHKLLSLRCQYHFAAYAHVSIVCPLADDREYYKDILKKEKVIFLQHGFTQNNLSSALNKYNQNFHAIITGNKEERDSYINFDYFYEKEKIKLLGFPRYDNLYEDRMHYITFAPTWRRYLFGDFIQQEEQYVLKDNFKASSYYQFYSQVINSDKLLAYARKYGYEIHFIPHPVFFPYIDMFEFDPEIHVHGTEVSYNQMFAKSSLFITDYSSAVFDFAYMKKPIIYTQFDAETFYADQYEKGLFDYRTEGFGPITQTVEETVNKIIDYIKNDCQMEAKYQERVLSFFEYHDKHNSERIFNEFYS